MRPRTYDRSVPALLSSTVPFPTRKHCAQLGLVLIFATGSVVAMSQLTQVMT